MNPFSFSSYQITEIGYKMDPKNIQIWIQNQFRFLNLDPKMKISKVYLRKNEHIRNGVGM